MTRLKQAWLALTRGLEVVYIPGKAMVRDIYRTDWSESRFTGRGVHTSCRVAFYETCADAHATGRKVTAVRALRTDDGYFLPVQELRRITVQPKPKRPKGKR